MTTKGTRDRLLDAARDLLKKGGVQAVTMGAVAKAADVSRQAVYLHFADRAQLLVELTEVIDKESDLDRWVDAMQGAPSASAAVQLWAEMQVERNPRLVPLGRALDAERSNDTASAAAWRNRLTNRLGFARVLVGRLAEEGKLHPSWDREHAALLLAELTSFRVWDDFVNEWEMPPAAYVRTVLSAALSSLAAPIAKLAPRAGRKK